MLGWLTMRRYTVVAPLLVVLVAVVYLGFAAANDSLGFPLDDSWIHQTYARSLAQTGRLAYGSARASAGSTSPLWTLLLSPGYVLPISPFLWTYLLGAASWLLSGWAALCLSSTS